MFSNNFALDRMSKYNTYIVYLCVSTLYREINVNVTTCVQFILLKFHLLCELLNRQWAASI